MSQYRVTLFNNLLNSNGIPFNSIAQCFQLQKSNKNSFEEIVP
jgi:hypothetical protein